MKKYILFLITTLISIFIFGQSDLAVIIDPDGFVNIRSDKNSDSKIIATLNEGDFFFCEPSNDNWWKVYTFQAQIGFVHKSRIILIKNLSDVDQRNMIINSFEGLSDFRQRYDSLLMILPEINRKELLSEFENFEDNVYAPLLSFLSTQFCKNKDVDLLVKFLKVMIINQMSAHESPAWTLGVCYLCYPDIVLQEINKYKGEEKDYLKNMLTFGFENITEPMDVPIDNYQELKEKLNE